MELRFRSSAHKELADAIVYFREIDHTLGVRFLREFESTIERLCQFPAIGHPRQRGVYRLAMIRGFPYGIAYSHDSKVLTVEAVPHLRQKVRCWRDLQS